MMNWKLFLTGCISTCIISLPQNIIGCGPGIDPYDYYTSFFNQHIAPGLQMKPFYYSGYTFLYEESDTVSPSEKLAEEWAAYCKNGVTVADAYAFVNGFTYHELASLYYFLEKSQPLKVSEEVKQNSMTKYFLAKKDLETLGYLMYAKQVEPYVLGNDNYWEPIQRDEERMLRLINNGKQLYAAAKTAFIQLKYGYQITRLAHYSGHYPEAIAYYDTFVAGNKTASVLQPMSLSLKAGALYRTGSAPEAAYAFSKLFMQSDVKRISNYISFFWAIDREKGIDAYLTLCKNDSEKAGMLALWNLGNPGNAVKDLERIFDLRPDLSALEILATREINKLEEKFLSPALSQQKGGIAFNYFWWDEYSNEQLQTESKHASELLRLLSKMGSSNQSSNPALFLTGAAYTAYMLKDYDSAEIYLAKAENFKKTDPIHDQWNLTRLLVSVNRQEEIDAGFEKEILPSIQWLKQKAKKDSLSNGYPYSLSSWGMFYRNFMNDILAKRYHAQNDFIKEILSIGTAESVYSDQYYDQTLNYFRAHLVSHQVETMYSFMTQAQHTPFENFLMENSNLKKEQLIDFAGTAYLRDYNYEQAIEWFGKTTNPAEQMLIQKNPFIELLYDREEALPADSIGISKIAFAREMLQLQKKVQQEKNKSKLADYYYKMALGMYNTTYYGHAWELVEYYRSGSDGYFIPQDASAFKREYYGCFTAHDYFKKAMDAASDKNMKAKCLFMMAKCKQKQLHSPQYFEYGYHNYDLMQEDEKSYFKNFKNNIYFPQFVKQFGKTAFYKEAFNSCSYLRDFVKPSVTVE